ncbi:MAG: helix-turn-helix domain-containing protein [Candidatus Obscuribacterales bacterium]|nr:helix-turn-helix domain-containing protein [Candidatus Obscuribacterales bacterium]
MSASNAQSSDIFESGSLIEASLQPGTESGTSSEPDRNSIKLSDGSINREREARISAKGEGYHDFFLATSGPENNKVESGTNPELVKQETTSNPVVSLSLKEAVDFYKISEKTIRLRIKEGKIPAQKVQGANVPEWRIYPNGIPSEVIKPSSEPVPELSEYTSSLDETDSPYAETEIEPEPEWYRSGSASETRQERPVIVSIAPELKTLMDVITKQAEKLEAANLRIGYLQAQTDNYQKEIKLLTDSQHKRGWWVRFSAWFIGKKD